MKTDMKTIVQLFILVLTVSCSREQVTVSGSHTLTVSIPAYPSPLAGTRTLIADKTAWEEGDALYLNIKYRDSEQLIEEKALTAVFTRGSWVFEQEILPPAGTVDIVALATYIGDYSPGEQVIENDFLHSSVQVAFDGSGIVFPAFKRLSSRIDFVNFSPGKIWFDAESYAPVLSANYEPDCETALPTGSSVTTDADGTASVFIFLTADCDCRFIIGNANVWTRLTKGKPDEEGNYFNRRYTVDGNSSFPGPGSVDLNVHERQERERSRFIAWATDADNGWNHAVNKDFTLMEDIDLRGIDWQPIGDHTMQYSGIFDGNGKTIAGLFVDSERDAGLFAYVRLNGLVKNLTVIRADVRTTGTKAGIIAGDNSGQILGCTVKDCSIRGSYIGSLVGYQEGIVAGCAAENCRLTSASGRSGGIAGMNVSYHGGVIIACRATDVRAGDAYAGGIVGDTYAKIISCYSAPASLPVLHSK